VAELVIGGALVAYLQQLGTHVDFRKVQPQEEDQR